MVSLRSECHSSVRLRTWNTRMCGAATEKICKKNKHTSKIYNNPPAEIEFGSIHSNRFCQQHWGTNENYHQSSHSRINAHLDCGSLAFTIHRAAVMNAIR
jgi:hypothetical protein